jgi:hypothetical protein
VALPDGTYNGVRSFTGPKSRTDPLACPPSTPLVLTVRGNAITFDSYEKSTDITRKWVGRIDQSSGRIGFSGGDAVPQTPNFYTILGDYRSATIDSRFCGPGTLTVTR